MYSWKDKLIDWANQKGAWTHILMGAGIALVIAAIILGAAMPSKGVVNTNAADISDLKNTMGTVADALSNKASQAEFDAWEADVNNALTDYAEDINDFGDRMNNAETRLNAVENDVAEFTYSPPEVYLGGEFPDYTLHAKSSETGTYTANVHLVYEAPILGTANYTQAVEDFYAGLTDSAADYVPVVTFNGMDWGVSEVWWNIGTFELVVKTETTIDITCAGLNSTWEPSFAYVEVWPILK